MLDVGGGDVVNVLAGGEVMPVVLGVGEMELKPTRSLRLAPWEPETGLGAASGVGEAIELVEFGGNERPGIAGFEVVELLGVAD